MNTRTETQNGSTASFSSPLAGEDSETQRSEAELPVDLGEGYQTYVGALARATPHQLRLRLTAFAKSSYPLPQGERRSMRCERGSYVQNFRFTLFFQTLIPNPPNSLGYQYVSGGNDRALVGQIDEGLPQICRTSALFHHRQTTSNQVFIPAAACSSMWQCKSHFPGLSATKVISIFSPRRIKIVSRHGSSSIAVPLREICLK